MAKPFNTLIEGFIRSVERNPDAEAVAHSGKRVTYGEWYDMLNSVPDPEEMDIDVEDIMGEESALIDEMDGFFDSMFSDLSAFSTDWSESEMEEEVLGEEEFA